MDHIVKNSKHDRGNGGLGQSNPTNLASAYPSSPIHDGTITDEGVKEFFKAAVQTGDVTAEKKSYGDVTIPASDGNRMSEFSVDFVGNPAEGDGVPNIEENKETIDGKRFGEGQGAPTTPYIPPLTSPGPNSVSATDQPAFKGVTPDPEQNIEFGSGLGGLANPSVTSAEIATQDGTVGEFLSGRSYEGSAG